MRVEYIVIHCSASPNGHPVTVDEIRRWHKARGFNDIGYHYVVGVGGTLMKGRTETTPGAHALGYNNKSLGVCMVGTDRFTVEQWATLHQTIEDMLERYPGAKVVGHRDLSPDLDGDGIVEPNEWIKLCPGFSVADWLKGGMATMPQHVCEVGR